jgi:hypothetical protein
MNTKPISHFSLLGPNAYSTSVLMGNRAFIRMWTARRAAKVAGNPSGRTLNPTPASQPAHAQSSLVR